MDVVAIVTAFAVLFIIIGLSEPLSARLRLPFSVVLAVIGTVLGVSAVLVQQTAFARQLDPGMLAILSLPIRSSVFLYVFLPTLIFQVALGLNLRRMMDDMVPILVMAVVAVVVATFFVGFWLQPFSQMPLIACLLLGAIVSTTDPSAVVSIFRSIAAPQRLTRIVEGESLLNDAAAIALFGFFLAFVMAGVPNPTLRDAMVDFPKLVALGLISGWIAGQLGLIVMSRFPSYPAAQMSLSIALPYVTYLVAERVLGASGIIAVVTAGMTLNLLGPGRLTPALWTHLREVWDLLAHWAGALIFIMAALLIPRLMANAQLWDLVLILVVTLAAFSARIVMLWGMLPLLHRMGFSPRVQRPYRVAILWGGLRGAITLTLALAVTENLRVPIDIKREIGILATGFTLMTLFLQGTTLRWVVKRLGLTKLAPLDRALSQQVIAVALQNVREDVAESVRDHDLDHDIIRSEAKRFGERLNEAVERAEEAEDIPETQRVTLGLLALAARERDIILEGFRQQMVSTRIVDQMLTDADRLIERTRTGGRNGYREAGRRALGTGRLYRLAVFLHNRLGYSRLLSNLTANRFEMLLNQRMTLAELHNHIDTKIRRIHGRRIADLLHDLLRRREEETSTALEGLRLQYPGYVEEIERRFIRRTTARMEEREYQILRDDGLIGPELYQTLQQDILATRARLEERPPLDLTMQKAELVQQFPLFASLPDSDRKQLTRALRTIYVHPGDIIMRKGEPARSVFFIASGAVEMDTAGHKERLGRGEMFGQIGILTRRPRRSQVKAISSSTLLSLDEARFTKLMDRSPEMRAIVEASTQGRRVPLPQDGAKPLTAAAKPVPEPATAEPIAAGNAGDEKPAPETPAPEMADTGMAITEASGDGKPAVEEPAAEKPAAEKSPLPAPQQQPRSILHSSAQDSRE
ncbi:cation:proton antiporter [Paracoccus pacificus]|uniref:Cation:proton antiporter n=1 Tax=Paracoccus pacificus TaxID=1463598 RepID=A0ABW4R9A2_9RHOB